MELTILLCCSWRSVPSTVTSSPGRSSIICLAPPLFHTLFCSCSTATFLFIIFSLISVCSSFVCKELSTFVHGIKNIRFLWPSTPYQHQFTYLFTHYYNCIYLLPGSNLQSFTHSQNEELRYHPGPGRQRQPCCGYFRPRQARLRQEVARRRQIHLPWQQ
jgi:hypothetical protein